MHRTDDEVGFMMTIIVAVISLMVGGTIGVFAAALAYAAHEREDDD